MASNRRKCSRVLILSVALALQVSAAARADGTSAETEVFLGPSTDAPASEGARPLGAVGKGLRVDLPPPPETSTTDTGTAPATGTQGTSAAFGAGTMGALVVGTGRELPAPVNKEIDTSALEWVEQPNHGKATTLILSSPDAQALRAGLYFYSLPNEAEFSFFPFRVEGAEGVVVTGTEINRSLERDRQSRDPDSTDPVLYWTPPVNGDTLGITIFLPAGVDPASVRMAIPELSHITTALMRAAQNLPSNLAGTSAECEKDVTCRFGAWGDISNAVAKILYTGADGQSFLCTGTLLADNDPNSQIPYFLTANHCIPNQAAASTLYSYWFYRTSACNAETRADSVALGGGATLLATLKHPDSTLLRLDRLPPMGVNMAGWSADIPYVLEEVAGVHHPRGDLQKISLGNITGYATCEINNTNPDLPAAVCASTGPEGKYVAIDWYYGLIEQGSSGSGIFDGTNHKLLGVASIGEIVQCSENQHVWYSRFDLAFDKQYHRWLAETSACNAEVGSWAYCSNPACGPCDEGEGDCDTDDQCKAGLVCAHDVGEAYGFSPTTDVCQVPGQTPAKLSCDLANGAWDFCSDARCGPCAKGQGDCDSDSECQANLVCVPNGGAKFGLSASIDVCDSPPAGKCSRINGDWQLCSDPNCGPCQVGQGDCDSDKECAAGLVCARNAGAKYGLPPTMDVCELPPVSACTLNPGDWGYCSDPACGPCAAGVGDCDVDADCTEGLTCVYNVGEKYGLPDTLDVCEAPADQ